MPPQRKGESESLGFHRRRSMGERKQRRERERELLPLCLFSVRRGRGHRGVVFVCYENPADAARWGSETKLKGAIPGVFREIAHSSLIMYLENLADSLRHSALSRLPVAVKEKQEEKRGSAESECGERDFCGMLSVWEMTALCSQYNFPYFHSHFIVLLLQLIYNLFQNDSCILWNP